MPGIHRERPGADAIVAATGATAVDLGDGIFMSPGLSNSYLLQTDDGPVIVNTGMGFEGPLHRQAFDAVDTTATRAVVLTQGHYDHVGGVDSVRDEGTEVIAQANDDTSLQLVAKTKAWPSPGAQWYIYRVKNSPIVEALTHDPVVDSGLSSRVEWLNANTTWWLDPTSWKVPLASSGPAQWPHVSTADLAYKSVALPTVAVSDLTQTSQSISFHVSRVGVPMLVKISYYPRWHASGATGPYRISPNLMVVIPTSTSVSLVYGASSAVTWGNAITDVCAA